MNTKEAKTHLLKHGKVDSIIEIKSGFKVKFKNWNDYKHYNPKEFIQLARAYSSENKWNSVFKKLIKRFSNSKNRSSTRDTIQKKEFDNIPNRTKHNKKENPWNWD